MVKKLLNISSWDPVLTCPEEDGADADADAVARSQVLENGNITNNIY